MSKPYRDDPKKIDPEIGNGVTGGKYTFKSGKSSTPTMTNGHHHSGDTLPTASYGNKSFMTIVENQ